MNELWQCSPETRKLVWVLFLGQVVSLLLSLGNLCSSMIAHLGGDAPLSQALSVYVLLAIVFGGIMLYRRQKLLVPWYWYLLLGFVDVQGNYLCKRSIRVFMFACFIFVSLIISKASMTTLVLGFSNFSYRDTYNAALGAVNKAYQYSSITSVALLDCWTVAWVIGLTWIFLGTRYSWWQIFGAAICAAGLGLVLLSDAGVGGGGGSRPLLGDILVIGATLCFATSNVSEEFCVKKKDLVEVLAMLGLFGALVSICQICIFEIKSLKSIAWSTEIILAACGFTLALFLFYILLPLVMQLSGATMLNLSLLTSDMWAVIFRIFFYHQKVDWLYYLSFATVAVGLVIYSKTGKDPDPMPEDSLNAQYQIVVDGGAVNEESGQNGTSTVEKLKKCISK